MMFMVYISYCILVNAIVLVSSIILGLLKFVLAKVFGKGMACPCLSFVFLMMHLLKLNMYVIQGKSCIALLGQFFQFVRN